MKVFYLANNYVGLRVGEILRDLGDEVVGLAVHPPERGKYRREIIETFGLRNDRVVSAESINDSDVHKRIKSWEPDVILSVFFGYILTPETLRLGRLGAVNLHNSYLPYNRGAYSNVWSIVTGTATGATLHFMDEGIDTGAIIDRMEVEVDSKDTGETLYRKTETACIELFERAWPVFRKGEYASIEQKHLQPTPTYKVRDVESIDRIDPDRQYRASELIDVLRARTFPPYKGAYMDVDGRRLYFRLQVLEESEL